MEKNRPLRAKLIEPKRAGNPYSLQITVPDEASGLLTLVRTPGTGSTSVNLDLRRKDHLESIWQALRPLFAAQAATPPGDAEDGLPGSPAGYPSHAELASLHGTIDSIERGNLARNGGAR